MARTKMPNLRNGSKGGFEPGSLDCESGILPLSYRAPYNKCNQNPNSEIVCEVLIKNMPSLMSHRFEFILIMKSAIMLNVFGIIIIAFMYYGYRPYNTCCVGSNPIQVYSVHALPMSKIVQHYFQIIEGCHCIQKCFTFLL